MKIFDVKKQAFRNAVLFSALSISASAIPFTHAMAIDENALPTGGNVVSGSATLDYNAGNRLDVYQGSDRTVIDWSSFNIGQNATTQFHQPSANAIVVNRVTGAGQDPSQILGTLSANGRVFVLDRNGVIFGEGSTVDVGSIVVGTGTIDQNAFMAGDNVLTIDQIKNNAAIINNGTITVAEAGLAAFVAPNIINNGIIQANMGSIALASGTKATLDLYGDKLVEVATDMALPDASIENNGTIAAHGGTVLITAHAAKEIIDSVINTSGLIDVTSVHEVGGKIVLEGANIDVSGTLDASGAKGGGQILVGGGYLGGGTTRRAENVTIVDNAAIKANTTGANGNGGEVIVWSEGSTRMNGKIEAKGGSASGNGGLVETSGKINLGLSGSVDASAPKGIAGEWLLDPSNVVVRATGGNNISSAGGTINPPSDSYWISDSSIEAALNLGNNVTITTTNGGGTEAGNIEFDWGGVSINKTSGASATLTLKANGSIYFNNSAISSTGAGNALNLVGWADFDGSGNDGQITHFGSINTNGGNISLVGGLDNGANGGIAADGIGDNYASLGIVTNGATLNAQGGNILLNGSNSGDNGIVLQGGSAIQTTGNGTITARGIGTTVGFGWSGGLLVQGNSTVSAQNGTINLSGTNTATTGMGVGVEINNGGQIYTTGTGDITITGTRTGSTSNYAKGIEMDGDTARVYSNNGNITMTGTASTSTAGVEAYGIFLTNGADAYSTGSGNLTFTGISSATTGSAHDFLTTGTNASEIGKANISTGAINFNVNTIDLANLATTVRTSGTLTVKPRTASTTIGLGGGAGTLNLTDSELFAVRVGTFVIGDNVLGSGDVDLDSWDLSGKTHHVEIFGNDIDIGGLTLGTGNFLAHAKDNGGDLGDLIVSSPTSKNVAGDSTLTLRADRNINFYNNMNIVASTGSLNVVFNADRDGDHDGAIGIPNTTITTNGGYAVLGGGSGTLWGADGIKGTADDGASTGAEKTAAWGNASERSGINLTSSSIQSAAGDIYITGHGHSDGSLSDLHGIWLNSAIVTSTSGKIYLDGTAGTGNVSNGGVTLQNNARVSSATGLISAKGTSADISGGYNNYGINIFSGGRFESTGNGVSAANIILDGYNYSNVGGFGFNDGKVTTVDGDIVMKSYAGNASKNNIIHLIGTSSIESTGDGNITIETVGGNSAGNNISFINGAVQNIGSATMTGDITLITNDIDSLEATDNIRTQGAVYLRPSVNSTTIGLGGGAGTFNLNDTELSAINAGTKLVIGQASSNVGDMETYTWDLSAKTYDVELYGNDINLGGFTLGEGNILVHAYDNGGDGGYITHNGAVSKSVAGHSTLTYKSQAGIMLNGPSITATGAGNTLDTVIWTDYDGSGQDGTFGSYTSVSTNGGNISLVGGLDNGANGGVAGDGIGDNAMLDGIQWGNTLDAQGGNILFRSHTLTNNGLYIGGAATVKTSGNGNIGIYGSGNTSDYGGAVRIDGAGNVVEAENGTITIVGTNNTANAGGQGVRINAGAQVRTTGASGGDIIITGTRSNANSWEGIGIKVDGDTTLISSNAGDITLIGTGGAISWANGIGIDLDDGEVNSSSGTITLNGVSSSVNGSATDLRINGSSTTNIGSLTSTGDILFNADTLSLTNASIRTLGAAYIKPRTASTSIGLGGGAGTLNLDDSELGMFSVGTFVIGDSASGTGDIDLDSWDLSGKTHAIELYGNDIDIGGLTLGTGNFTAHAKDNGGDVGDLNVSALISKNQATDSLLNLRADESVSIGTVSYSNMIGATGAGKLNIILNSDRDADQTGKISIGNAGITTNGGDLALGGGVNPSTDYAWGVAASFTGISLGNAQVNLGTGNFIANGHGRSGTTGFGKYGVSTSYTKIETTTGNIMLNGDGGIGTSSIQGVSIGNGGTSGLVTTSGNITITGKSAATAGTNNEGILVSAVPITTDSGTVTMTGTGSFGSAGISLLTDNTNYLTLGGGDAVLTSLAGDLVIDKGIRKTSGAASNLTLRSNGNIILNQYADITSTSNALNIVLNADRDGDQNGAISLWNSAVTTNGGYFVAGGGSGTLGGTNGILGDGDGTGADDVAAYGNSAYSNGITLNNGDVTTTGGNIYLRGMSGLSSGSGVQLTGGSLINSQTGSINVTGTSRDSAGAGLYLHYGNGGVILDSTTGNITLSGTAAGAFGAGIRIETDSVGNAKVRSQKGAILLNGTGSNYYGLELEGGQIESTGTGSDASTIIINATGSTDVAINRSYAKIASIEGAININGLGTNSALYMNDGGSVGSTGGADISIFGRGITTNSGVTTVIGGPSASGNILLNTDSLNFGNATDIQSSGTITIKPRTASASIGLGGDAGTLNLTDAELSYITAGTLIIGDSVLGTGDIDIDSWDLSTKTHHVQLFGNDIDLGGITTGAGNVYLYAKGGNITASANSASNGAGHLNLLAGDNITVNGAIINAGAGHINAVAGWDSSSAITTDALFDIGDIVLNSAARDIIIGTNGAVSSAGTGTSVLLVASNDFINNSTAGINAISASGGRYLVYSDNPTDTIKNGLTGKSLYNRDFATDKPSSIVATGNRFLYKYQPTLTVTADNITAPDVASAVYTYTVSGLINGDLAADSVSGTPSFALGAPSGNTRSISPSALTSPSGYNINYAGGLLTLLSAPQTPTASAPALMDAPKVIVNSVVKIGAPNTVSDQKKQEEAEAYAGTSDTQVSAKSANCLVTDASTQTCIVN